MINVVSPTFGKISVENCRVENLNEDVLAAVLNNMPVEKIQEFVNKLQECIRDSAINIDRA